MGKLNIPVEDRNSNLETKSTSLQKSQDQSANPQYSLNVLLQKT